jgi:hypothetical protein
MPAPTDFRTFTFDLVRVDSAGKNVGRGVYWKLYAIENIVRVIIHSVLVVQIGPGWWATATGSQIQKRVAGFMAAYAKKPWHSTPGKHEIYYTFLGDLNEIIRANSHLFVPVIPDIDQWIARLEQIRAPRNIVGHMLADNGGSEARRRAAF